MNRIVGPEKVETTAGVAPVEKAHSASSASSASSAPLRDGTASGVDSASLHGLSLADASVALGGGRSLVADYVVGTDSRLAEIRLIDPTTHQVVAASPPDSIAQIQQEMRAYQVAAQARPSTSTPQIRSAAPLDTAFGAE